MAKKKLNKYAILCEEAALVGGKITADSSPRTLIYDISRSWRALLDATDFRSERLKDWSEKEELAAEIIISAMAFLQRVGCKDIERLLEDCLEQYSKPG